MKPSPGAATPRQVASKPPNTPPVVDLLVELIDKVFAIPPGTGPVQQSIVV